MYDLVVAAEGGRTDEGSLFDLWSRPLSHLVLGERSVSLCAENSGFWLISFSWSR